MFYRSSGEIISHKNRAVYSYNIAVKCVKFKLGVHLYEKNTNVIVSSYG